MCSYNTPTYASGDWGLGRVSPGSLFLIQRIESKSLHRLANSKIPSLRAKRDYRLERDPAPGLTMSLMNGSARRLS